MSAEELYAAHEAARDAYGPFSKAAMARRLPGIAGYDGYTPEDQAEFKRLCGEIDRTYQAYLDALPLRWYVTTAHPESVGEEDDVWTLSHDPKKEGWSTDSSCDGYGLTFADATELADAANAVWKAKTTP